MPSQKSRHSKIIHLSKKTVEVGMRFRIFGKNCRISLLAFSLLPRCQDAHTGERSRNPPLAGRKSPHVVRRPARHKGDLGQTGFAIDQRHQSPVALRPDDGVDFPIAHSRAFLHHRWTFTNGDPIQNLSAPLRRSMALAPPSTQAQMLVQFPIFGFVVDHKLADPLIAGLHACVLAQPTANLLTPRRPPTSQPRPSTPRLKCADEISPAGTTRCTRELLRVVVSLKTAIANQLAAGGPRTSWSFGLRASHFPLSGDNDIVVLRRVVCRISLVPPMGRWVWVIMPTHASPAQIRLIALAT